MLQLTKFTTDQCLPPKRSTVKPSRSPACPLLPSSVATSCSPAWEVPKHDSTLPRVLVGTGGRWSAASLPPGLRSHDPSGGTPIPPIHATINEVHHPRPMTRLDVICPAAPWENTTTDEDRAWDLCFSLSEEFGYAQVRQNGMIIGEYRNGQ